MKDSKIAVSLLFVLFCVGCKPENPTKTDTSANPLDITIDVTKVLRPLSGDEIGLNVNYLMDDKAIPGNNYNKIIDSLKKINPKILRYPGGEKSDNYYFSSPPYTASAPRAAYCSWPSTDNRFFNYDLTCKQSVLDFDEFMEMCQELEAKPLIVVGSDAMYYKGSCGRRPLRSALITNAQEWVRYANKVKGYGIKLWMIGNETWFDGTYNGVTTASQYALDLAEFADSMRAIDPTIKIIANGRSDWWSTLLSSSAASKIDYLAVSNYLPYTQPITSYEKFKNNRASLNNETDQAIRSIANASSNAERTRIQVIEAEYNSLDFTNGWAKTNDLGHALCSFQMMAGALTKPKLYASCFWNTRWVENITKPQDINDAMDKDGKLNANGIALSILSNNLLSVMVDAGSKDNVLSYATYADNTKKLNVFLLNKETKEMKIKLNISNYQTSFTYEKWEFTGKNPDDKFPTWRLNAKDISGNNLVELTLPAHSVTMLSAKP